jgi:hypothetical protein
VAGWSELSDALRPCSSFYKKTAVWALWRTAVCAVVQGPVGAIWASTGPAASKPYAAAAWRFESRRADQTERRVPAPLVANTSM